MHRKVMNRIMVVGLASIAADGAMADSKATYTATCAACHSQGIAGALKFGDKEAWKDRVTKERSKLYKNVIEGYQSSSGVMPPKGGFMNLSDEEVKAAVDYMVENSK